MSESEMGNRVSKSAILAVKEQRVDGGSHVKGTWLRYTLMVQEIGYQINVLSKNISNLAHLDNSVLRPWFITGFTEAEGCFNVKLTKSDGLLPWRVNVSFLLVLLVLLVLHVKDKSLLEDIQLYFGGIGTVKVYKDIVRFDVSSVKDLANIIIPHFQRFPLLTQKRADFLLFEKVVNLMIIKQHLTMSGLLLILGLRANLNKGWNVKGIPGCQPVARALVTIPDTLHGDWVAGFTSGDGCFFVSILKVSDYKIGYRTALRYEICQDERDLELMN